MSTIAVAKGTQGFMPANRRPSCRNCDLSKELPASGPERGGWLCGKGGFFVTALAVCNDHVPKGAASSPPPPLTKTPIPEASSNE